MLEVFARLQVFAVQLLAALIDSLFVALWLILHTAFEEHVASRFHLEGIHAVTLSTFQALFAIATLFPVAAYVVVDLHRIYRRTRNALVTPGER